MTRDLEDLSEEEVADRLRRAIENDPEKAELPDVPDEMARLFWKMYYSSLAGHEHDDHPEVEEFLYRLMLTGRENWKDVSFAEFESDEPDLRYLN